MFLTKILDKPFFTQIEKTAITGLLSPIINQSAGIQTSFIDNDGKYQIIFQLMEDNEYFIAESGKQWIFTKIKDKKEVLQAFYIESDSHFICYVFNDYFIPVSSFIENDTNNYTPQIASSLILYDTEYRLDVLYNYNANKIENVTLYYTHMKEINNNYVQQHYYSCINLNTRQVIEDYKLSKPPTNTGIVINLDPKTLFKNDILGELFLQFIENHNLNHDSLENYNFTDIRTEIVFALKPFEMSII